MRMPRPAALALRKPKAAPRRGRRRQADAAQPDLYTRLFVPRLLLIEADAFGVRAAVAERRREWRLGRQAHSRHYRPAEALAEITTELGPHLPGNALLLTSAALALLADLPVDPARPRPPAQMREMVRYESEPLVSQHNNLWTMGEVLAALGLLDGARRREVAVALETRRMDDAGQSVRFGEMAGELGFVAPERIEDAILRQHWQLLPENELVHAWRAQPGTVPPGEDWPRWRAAVCAEVLRDTWYAALREQGLRLRGIVPSAGLAGHPPAGAAQAGVRLVVEIRPEQIVCTRHHGARTTGMTGEARMERPVAADWIAELLGPWLSEQPEALDLVVEDRDTDAERLAAQLEGQCHCPVQVLADGAAAAAELRFRAVLAEQDLDRSERRLLVLPPRQASAPPWKTRGGRAALALGAVLLGIALWEGRAQYRIHTYERQAVQIRDGLRQRSENPEQAMDAEARRLEAQVAEVQTELSQVLSEAERLDTIARRSQALPAIIRLLGRVIGPEVVLDGLEEGASPNQEIGIRVRAWSVSDALAQRFASNVQQSARGLGLSVAQVDLHAAVGRTGGNGYAISFWLIPLPPDDGLEQR
ncbi:hypothetical protein [Pseudothauera rhizosphaerae]|uniref:Uncharacterized protein n=1 Tax=Pseudothauera rhizosphaerae TaxID=2565932 RepID=A0A4S4AVU5_9RHOO|nr:hypothetical protein [Pseudothauera rhizosphaerae]THF62686.1 hypothetical protein E6O51_06930 [Pseudothauera rhizosphaerae]